MCEYVSVFHVWLTTNQVDEAHNFEQIQIFLYEMLTF